MENTPRVLHVCAVDFTARHFVAPVAEDQARRGCKVRIACGGGSDFDYLREQGLHMVELPIARSRNLLKHRRSYKQLVGHLRENSYHIVHVHTPVASFIGRQAATKARVPLRFYTAHGFYFHEGMPWLNRTLHARLEKHFAKRCDHIFTVSGEDRETALYRRFGPPHKITYVGQGVDPAVYDPARYGDADRLDVRSEFGMPHDATVVAITARLVREKGYFELLEAARLLCGELPRLYFLAIGDALESDRDDQSLAMREFVKEHGLEGRFIFAGRRDDVPLLLAASDIFALPSYREGMPVSVLEALALALPCVVSDVRGCREEVVDGECGFVVPPCEAEPLAARIRELAEDRQLARRLGEAARRRVLERFTLQQYFDRQWKVYERLIAEKL